MLAAAMQHVTTLALVLLLACGGKSKPDCEAYATKYADTLDPDPSRRATVLEGERRACENGRISAEQIKCVKAAASADDVRACMGLSGEVKTEQAAKISVVSVEGGGVKPVGQMPAEQKRWFDELQRRLANCEPAAGAAEATFAVTVTFTADRPTVDAASAPDALRGCIERILSSAKPHPGSLVDFDVPITFQIKVRGDR